MTAFGKIAKYIWDYSFGFVVVTAVVAAVLDKIGKGYRYVGRYLGFEMKEPFDESKALEESVEKLVYCGFDPAAESLHLGNLLAIIVLSWFQRCGHQAAGLIDGATGRVCGPSGKSLERPELDSQTLEKNIAGIKNIIVKILGGNPSFGSSYLINNYDWWKDMTMLDFLKKVGRFARVGPMLAKESVKKRLESEQGMSYTELSYQLLQGYDFVHLFDKDGVNVKIGGSDQWGNITAGTDLIWNILHREEAAYGLTLRELQRIYQLAHCLLIESLVFLLWISIVDMLVSTGLFESKSAARRTLKQGGVYMNNERVDDEKMILLKGKVLSSLQLRRTKWSSEFPEFSYFL
ncbi:unnamed protein product [Brassica oleracea]